MLRRDAATGLFVLVVFAFVLAGDSGSASGLTCAAASQDESSMALSKDAYPTQASADEGGLFEEVLTVTDVNTVNGVLSVITQMKCTVEDVEGNVHPVVVQISIPLSLFAIKTLPGVGRDTCFVLALQANSLNLHVKLLGLDLLLQVPHIDQTAAIPKGTPACDRLHRIVGF